MAATPRWRKPIAACGGRVCRDPQAAESTHAPASERRQAPRERSTHAPASERRQAPRERSTIRGVALPRGGWVPSGALFCCLDEHVPMLLAQLALQELARARPRDLRQKHVIIRQPELR